jgi:hypothetical protein
MKKNTMVDLETLGRRAGCSILSIGAVHFDEHGVEDEFYIVVNKASCTGAGLHVDPDTLAWWEKQSPEARQVLVDAEAGTLLADALDQFGAFAKGTNVWGNGADFDNAILYACYAAVGKDVPWPFWNSRCYRTLKNLYKGTKLERQGTYHNALDDAKTQAEHASLILRTCIA